MKTRGDGVVSVEEHLVLKRLWGEWVGIGSGAVEREAEIGKTSSRAVYYWECLSEQCSIWASVNQEM